LQNIELEKGQFLVMTIGMEEKKIFGGGGGKGFAQSILLFLFLFKDLVEGLKHSLRLLSLKPKSPWPSKLNF